MLQPLPKIFENPRTKPASLRVLRGGICPKDKACLRLSILRTTDLEQMRSLGLRQQTLQIGGLTNNQVAAFTTVQLTGLDTDDFRALTTAQFAAMSTRSLLTNRTGMAGLRVVARGAERTRW